MYVTSSLTLKAEFRLVMSENRLPRWKFGDTSNKDMGDITQWDTYGMYLYPVLLKWYSQRGFDVYDMQHAWWWQEHVKI